MVNDLFNNEYKQLNLFGETLQEQQIKTLQDDYNVDISYNKSEII